MALKQLGTQQGVMGPVQPGTGLGFVGPTQPNVNLGSPVVSADDYMTSEQPIQLPTYKTPSDPTQFVNNLTPVVNQSNQGLVRAETEEARKRDDVLNRLLNQDQFSSQDLYNSSFKGAGGDRFLADFTDANTKLAVLQGKFNTAKQAVSGSTGQSQVQEGFSLNEIGRQQAVEVGNQALVVQALQGNVETARQIATDTVRFASEDRQAELQTLLAQYDALDGIVSRQEQQIIDANKEKAAKELRELEYTRTLSLQAISSGLASVEEMQQLTNPNVDDLTKQTIAQNVISKAAAEQRQFTLEDRALDRMDKMSLIANRGSSGSSGGAVAGAYIGPDGKPLKLTATQVDSISGLENTVGIIGDALGLLNSGVQTGPVAGRTLGVKKFFGAADPKQLELDQKLSKLKADFMKSLSGAAVSEQEVKRLEKFLPSITDQENVIASKLATLRGEAMRTKETLLQTLGATQPSEPNVISQPDGTAWRINPDGSYTQVR